MGKLKRKQYEELLEPLQEELAAWLATVPRRAYPTMAELDAIEYDDEGDCR